MRERELAIKLELARLGVPVAIASSDDYDPTPYLINLELRGGALDIQSNTDRELMLSGPSETGKTIASLVKLHNIAVRWPGAHLTIARKTYASCVGSVVQSFINKVLPLSKMGVHPFGGKRPAWFDYDNGSRIWVAGMDNKDATLSTERGATYINQAEEIDLEDWEYLATRTTGREGIVTVPQLFGDCNPGAPTHWILARRDSGRLNFFESRHEDNPRLYTADGVITPAGVMTMDVLDNTSGVRKQRLRYGKWVQAEGVVYEEFDRKTHLIDRFEIPATWRRYRVIDFGFTNPFVCQWWALDDDGRAYMYREIYMTKRLVEDHAAQIKALSHGERIEATTCDHDAEDRATLHKRGIATIPAIKDVVTGIQAVQSRLKVQPDGKPRLFVLRDSLVEVDETLREAKKPFCTEHEFDMYMWPKNTSGKPVKELPMKEHDHGMDDVRYFCMHLEKRGKADPLGANRRLGAAMAQASDW